MAATLAVGLGERGPDGPAAQIFRSAGWPQLDAQRASRAATHFILGHVMQEQTRQNLLRVGVLAAPAEALDDAAWSHYVDLNGRFHALLGEMSGSEVIRKEVERVSRLPFASASAIICRTSAGSRPVMAAICSGVVRASRSRILSISFTASAFPLRTVPRHYTTAPAPVSKRAPATRAPVDARRARGVI